MDAIALIDCNNFYVECERLFNPALRNRPVAVLSNNDGCIVARSNEVKALGIPMGIPVFQARDDLLHNNVELFSSNYTLYGDMSHRVVDTLRRFTSRIEVYSIDESFLVFPDACDNTNYAHRMRRTVKQWTGIPVSIGIGQTKSLAKLANKLAKRHQLGVLDLIRHPRKNRILDTMPVSDVWGIGKRYTEKLNQHGIETAYQLSRADDKWVQKHLTIAGLRLVWELRGIACLPLEYTPPPKKAIGRSRSFGRPITNVQHIREALAMHVVSAAKALRAQNTVAGSMHITIETNPFVHPYYGKTITARFETPTAFTPAMIRCAHEGLNRIFKSGECYTRAGVLCTDLQPENAVQTSLFWDPNTKRNRALLKVADDLMTRWGRRKIRWASEGRNRIWNMRRAHLSKHYTTRWDDILEIEL